MLQSEDTLYFKLYIPECLKHRYHFFFITPALQKQSSCPFVSQEHTERWLSLPLKQKTISSDSLHTQQMVSFLLYIPDYHRCSLGSTLLLIILKTCACKVWYAIKCIVVINLANYLLLWFLSLFQIHPNHHCSPSLKSSHTFYRAA